MICALFILIWLLVGAMLGAFLMGKIGADWNRYGEKEPIIWAVLTSAVFWPLVLLGLLFYPAVRWALDRGRSKNKD